MVTDQKDESSDYFFSFSGNYTCNKFSKRVVPKNKYLYIGEVSPITVPGRQGFFFFFFNLYTYNHKYKPCNL